MSPAFRSCTAQAATEAEAALELAPVTIDGRTLFQVRGISSYWAEVRAAEVAERIRSAADDPAFEPEQLEVVEAPGFSQIGAGQRLFLRLFEADAEIERVERQALALVAAQKIRDAVKNYRAHRKPEYVMRGLVTVLIATIVVGSEAFKGLSIFFGVLLSIGSSSFVANSVAGYALIYRRLYTVGNRVQIGDLVGEVIEVRLQVTRLRTVIESPVARPNRAASRNRFP